MKGGAIICWLLINNSVLILATYSIAQCSGSALHRYVAVDERSNYLLAPHQQQCSHPCHVLHNVLVQHYTARWQWMRGAIICWLPINNSVSILVPRVEQFWFNISPLGVKAVVYVLYKRVEGFLKLKMDTYHVAQNGLKTLIKKYRF